MSFSELIDVKEEHLKNVDEELLTILLIDHTTNKNIIWGTDIYSNRGIGFDKKDNISIYKVTGNYKNVIKPRTKKSKEEQIKRSRDKAEVFTPSWMCNKQNNIVDSDWFGYKDVFNTEKNTTWITKKEAINFPTGKTWKDYVELLRLEISCGEAPYLVSRYDTVTGDIIKVNERIGLLDRKFRVINENAQNEDEWFEWSKIAIKSIYGYDWQGDNVLIARENLLYTFIDNYKFYFSKKPDLTLIKEIAEIISWNIWQMDGINFVIPYSCKNERIVNAQLNIFGEEEVKVIECIGCKKNNYNLHNGIYSKIMNWKTNRANKFVNIVNKKGRW